MILDDITAAVAVRLQEDKEHISLAQMEAMAAAKKTITGYPFEKALAQKGVSAICEVKKASPSKGLIAAAFPYVDIAREYEAAGAAAISVLTERDYFQGSPDFLAEIADSVSIPVLRKDFIIDAYQIYEAKTLGASAILLICAILDETTLQRFFQLADRLGLSVLVEAHDAREVQKAVRCGARVIGVNNRNLKDFTVTLDTSRQLGELIPEGTLFVSESGIRTAEDVRILASYGADAVLIGETLMRSKNKKAMLQQLLGR